MCGADAAGGKSAARLLKATLHAACALAVLLVVPGLGTAQEGARPPQVDPRQSQRAFEQLEAEKRHSATPSVTVPQVARPQARADTKPIVKLVGVSVQGAHAIGPAGVAAAYSSYLNKMISQADLVEIAGRITQLYRDAGYHLSRAIVPPQDIKDGHVTIRMIEGSISELVVRGKGAEEFGAPSILQPITLEHPSRLSTVERQLLLANDRPGMRITDATLEEIGDATGHFRLTVYVKTWRIYAAGAVDNLGSAAVGPVQTYATAALNSYFTPGDALTLNASTIPTEIHELAYGGLSYDRPIGTDGFRVGATAWYSSVWPGDYRRLIDTRTENIAGELRGSIVPVKSQSSSLSLIAALGIWESSETNDFGIFYRDHIRTMSFAGNYTFTDPLRGRNYLDVLYRQGLGVLGASQADDPLASRYGASGIFSVIDLAFTRYQPLSDAWSVKLAAAAQFASAPLLTSQQFYLGGLAFGRGFDSGEISGDNGVAGTVELRFDQSVDYRVLKGYQLYGFVDSGAVWDTGGGVGTLSLTSAGAGVRFYLKDEVQAGIAIAVPLEYRALTFESHAPRLLFSISSAFKVCPDQARMRCS